ncbi:MAG: DUF2062 domain-containing protein [Perlucidibaca sp.]
MPKALLKRYLPDPERILAARSLGFLGNRLRDPSLWHLNRRSASGAAFWGLFCAFLPMPLQMVPAALGARVLRVNLPVTMVLVWLTNPLTWLPCMYLSYSVGSWVTGAPSLTMAELRIILDQLAALLAGGGTAGSDGLSLYLHTFVIGCLTTGLAFGGTGYVSLRLYWRWHVVHAWQARRRHRQDQR